MPIPQDRLTTKALLALEEVTRSAEAGPVSPSLAVRFALAYLYSVGGGNREAYDLYWRTLTGGSVDHAQCIQRAAIASATLSAIYLDVGRERSPAMMFYEVKRNRRSD